MLSPIYLEKEMRKIYQNAVIFSQHVGDYNVEKKVTYGKCPKIFCTKVSDKMAYANSVDSDQIDPEGSVLSGSTLFAIPLSILRNNCIKKQNLGKK